MDIYIERNITYFIKNYNVYCTANITLGIMPVKIKMLSNGCSIIIKQYPFLLKLINSLPILNCENFTPFKIYKDNVKCGKGKHILFKPLYIFTINNDIYEIRHHSNNYISLMRNNVQIALYYKNITSVAEHNIYNVKCVYDTEMLNIILLFCAFIDVIFYPNNGNFSYIKKEKTFVFNDKYEERINWKPPKNIILW